MILLYIEIIIKKQTFMKTLTCKPVLVNSKERTNLYVWDDRLYFTMNPNNISDTGGYNKVPTQWKELVLISSEHTDIEVNDVVLCTVNNTLTHCRIKQDITENVRSFGFNMGSIKSFDYYFGESVIPSEVSNYKKVIVRLSQIPIEYIQQLFVREYNAGKVKDLTIEMEVDADDKRNWYVDCPSGKYWMDEPIPPTKDNLYTNAKYLKPKLTRGIVNIVSTFESLADNWESELAIQNIPELPHVINSVRELRRYYIDGLQLGYEKRKSEELVLYTEEEVKDLFKRKDITIHCWDDKKYGISFDEWFEQNKKK